jgi:hypothetical protein
VVSQANIGRRGALKQSNKANYRESNNSTAFAVLSGFAKRNKKVIKKINHSLVIHSRYSALYVKRAD